MYMRIYMQICMYTYIYTETLLRRTDQICLLIYICICTYMYIYVYICIYACVVLFMHIYTHTYIPTDCWVVKFKSLKYISIRKHKSISAAYYIYSYLQHTAKHCYTLQYTAPHLRYGVATVSKIDKIIGHFCRIASLL